MSAVRRLEFKLKIFMETKSDEETPRVENNDWPGVKLPKFEQKINFWRSFRMGDI